MRRNPNDSNFRPFEGDEMLVVKFYMDERKNEILTQERGHAVFEDVEMVSIQVPGNSLVNVKAPADSYCTMPDGSNVTYAERFPEDYDRFTKGKDAVVKGIPLKNVPFLTRAEVSTLEAQNVYTVEQLADIGGASMRNLGVNGRQWQQNAQGYLQGAANVSEANAEREAKDKRIAELEAKLAEREKADAKEEKADEPAEDEKARKAELKEQIKELTGTTPRGDPSVANLEKQLEEAKSAK